MSTFLTRSPVSCSRKVSPIAGLLRILSRVTELLIARVMDKLQEHRLEIVPPWLQFVFIMILKYTCTHIQYVYEGRRQQDQGLVTDVQVSGVWEVTPATGVSTTTHQLHNTMLATTSNS